jgi:hypothetical protein
VADRRLGVGVGGVQEKVEVEEESEVDVTTEMCGPRFPFGGAKRTGSVNAALTGWYRLCEGPRKSDVNAS